MKHKIKTGYIMLTLLSVAAFMSSCYKNIIDYPYPDQAIYMPAAVSGNYVVNTFATPGLNYRYLVDQPGGRLNIPLSVYRSGINASGDVNVTITPRTDTVTTLIAAGLTNTVIIPASKFTLPSSVTVPNGGETGTFSLSVDMAYLLANPAQSYAIAVGISSTTVKSTAKNVTVVVINPAFLIPSANFTYAIDATTAKKVNFTNTSTNSLTYSWNFGDASATVTDVFPSHVYAASGSYTVTLISSGAAGTINPSLPKTLTVVVP